MSQGISWPCARFRRQGIDPVARQCVQTDTPSIAPNSCPSPQPCGSIRRAFIQRRILAANCLETTLMRPVVRFCLPLFLLLNCSSGFAQSPLPASHECMKVLSHADRGWLVFFDSHSAELTPRARGILKELASVFLEDHGRIMALNGNIDGAETSAEDLGLGLRRAKAVAAALKEAGLNPTAIYTKDFGLTAPIASNPPGISDPQNRRVDLIPMAMWSDSSRRAIRDCKAWVRASCFASPAAEQHALCERSLNILAPTD